MVSRSPPVEASALARNQRASCNTWQVPTDWSCRRHCLRRLRQLPRLQFAANFPPRASPKAFGRGRYRRLGRQRMDSVTCRRLYRPHGILCSPVVSHRHQALRSFWACRSLQRTKACLLDLGLFLGQTGCRRSPAQYPLRQCRQCRLGRMKNAQVIHAVSALARRFWARNSFRIKRVLVCQQIAEAEQTLRKMRSLIVRM